MNAHRSRVQIQVLILVAASSVAIAADLVTLSDGGGVTRFAVADDGSARVEASSGMPALTVTQSGAGEAARVIGGTLRVGDGAGAAGVVIDDLTVGVSPTLTQAAAGAVFGGVASNADAWHTHAALGGGGVKSIQRGNAVVSLNSLVTVNLATPVDWTKSIILLEGSVAARYLNLSSQIIGVAGHQPHVVDYPSSSSFRIRTQPALSVAAGASSGTITWQVVEYP